VISDYLAFFSELPSSFKEIGSVIPSSPFLVKKLLTAMPGPERSRRILEVGPGTGALTKKILENLTPKDEFVLYEKNEVFAQYLANMLAEKNGSASNVKLLNADIRDLGQNPEEKKFDVIFSGLPFTNFEAGMVEEIANLLRDNLKQGGTLAFFGYLALPKIRQIYASPKEKKRIKEVVDTLEKFCAQATSARVEKVFLNIPPAHGTMLNFS
jgi:phosphatidylethanolamine/phosphatidyl-N-methylethanolamine N-methyltransferase